MLDWRSFKLLYGLTRFGVRNQEMTGEPAQEERNDAPSEWQDNDIVDLRQRQEALLGAIAHTLRKAEIEPYRELIGRFRAISQRPAG